MTFCCIIIYRVEDDPEETSYTDMAPNKTTSREIRAKPSD
jgi:hypothetical protein